MYKLVTMTAAVVIASTVSSLAQTINHGGDDQLTFNTETGVITQTHSSNGSSETIDFVTQSEFNSRGDSLSVISNTARSETNEDNIASNDVDIRLLQDGNADQHRRISALESRPVVNGRDGTNGARGAQGEQGVRGETGARGATGAAGRDGQDADVSAIYEDVRAVFNHIEADFEDARVQAQMGIAGTAALSFANSGGSGLGIGIAGHQGQNAGAISYTHTIDNQFSASFGATTTGTVGAGVKWKF